MMVCTRAAKIHGLAQRRPVWIYDQAHRRPAKVHTAIHVKSAHYRPKYGLLVVHGLIISRAQYNMGPKLF
jgi:hypothetical protein